MTTAAFNSTNMNSIILALCKWAEFYNKYCGCIPAKLREENKSLKKKLDSMKILEFRNRYIGHIQDKGTQSPLSFEQVDDYYASITQSNRREFLLWVNGPVGSDDVVDLLEKTRDGIKNVYV